MERNAIIEAFKATTSATHQNEATQFLTTTSGMIGFPLVLLDIISDPAVDDGVKLATVIYFKNSIRSGWTLDPEDVLKITPISEQDKIAVRQSILPKIVSAPEALKVHLCTSIQFILRHDFPEVWPGIIEDLLRLFHSNEGQDLYAALLVTHRLAKIFEYKRQIDRAPFVSAMSRFLPLLYSRFSNMIDDVSQESNTLQKLILKIFYCYVQFSLSTEVMNAESFGLWLGLFVKIVERDVPAEVDTIDPDERGETIWWKCKKWALKIIERVFERYGSKGHVEQIYQEFADYYTANYMTPVITSVMKVLERYVSQQYVSERVLYLSLCHVSDGLSHGTIWKMIKPHMDMIFNQILFPLMMFTDTDEELWEDDPEVYLREKNDCFEEIRNPASAAARFIHAAAKRKGILQPLLVQVIAKLDQEQISPNELDGALHVIECLAGTLAEDRRYKKDVEKLLDSKIKPRITHPTAFVRARALTVIKEAADAPMSNRIFVADLIEQISQRLKDPNEELPVKFEAAMAIHSLVNNQGENIAAFVKPKIGDLINEVLRMLGKHNLEDLPVVIESLIENYEEDVIPAAADVVYELVQVFNKLSRAEDGSALDENSMTIMGVLGTLQSILILVEDKTEIIIKVEPLIIALIADILDSFASDYFEEVSSFIDCLLTVRVSPDMWVVYDKLLDAFEAEGSLFFSDAMPAFCKFVGTDTNAFLADPNRVRRMLVMVETVLNDNDCGTDIQSYAVKMMEIILNRCKGRINEFYPHIVALTMKKLLEDQTTFEEIQAQCVVTLFACLFYDHALFVQQISQYEPQHQNNFNWFYEFAFNNYNRFNGIHDRSVLLYALFIAFKFPAEQRPAIVNNTPAQVMEIVLKLFADIQKCRRIIAQQEDEDSDNDDDENEDEAHDNDLHDSDDDVNDHEVEYLQSLDKHLDVGSNSDYDETRHDFLEVTELEEFETNFDGDKAEINVHVLFMDVMKDLEATDAALYSHLLHLSDERKNDLNELIQLCNKEKEHLLSKQLNTSGGYDFSQNAQAQFNFHQ